MMALFKNIPRYHGIFFETTFFNVPPWERRPLKELLHLHPEDF
jgi:hypothetical protein